MVIFVIGPPYTGKSHFIKHRFGDGAYSVFDVYDYQELIEDEVGLPMWERLFRANERLNADVAELVRQGKNVIVEQTFLRALRQIDCVDAIRAVSEDVSIEVYAMTPSDKQLRHNCAERAKKWGDDAEKYFESTKRKMTETWEFPNPAEGYSKIYEVSGDEITERRDDPDWEIVRWAHEELVRDRERLARGEEEWRERRRERQARQERHDL